MHPSIRHPGARFPSFAAVLVLAAAAPAELLAHGTVVSPVSRVYRVYQSNPENPNFPLAANAVAIDGKLSYYTWNEVSRNIPQAVQAGLPPGYDYSPWMPDGQLASAGRVDPQSSDYPRTYAGLDQVSPDWPKTSVTAGETITVDWYATAPHDPSVWDVWMTTPDWSPSQPLTWGKMEFLGRPTVTFSGSHYTFDLTVPVDRAGHHVLWVAWQRNDPVGEVFVSTTDLDVRPIHDECDGALPIVDGVNATASTEHATTSAPSASCEPAGGADVWFRYQATCSGTLRADTCATSGGLDTVVSIWSGSCGALTEIGCNDDACGPRSAATAAVTAGNTVFVKVGSRAGTPPGEFQLTISYDNGTGSFSTSSPGCGPATLTASGAPNIGGLVHYAMSGGVGATQLLWVGAAPTSLPMCTGCTVGTPITFVLPSAFSAMIPCQSSLVGIPYFIQGADITGTSGGCNYVGGLDFTLTETVRTVIGG